VKSRFLPIVLLIVAIRPAVAQEIKAPSKVEGDVGDFVTIAVKADGVVKWITMDRELKLFPTELLKDSRTAVVTCSVPGLYRLMCYTAKGDVPSDPAIIAVSIRAPPGPGPRPGPSPGPEPGPAPEPQPDPYAKSITDALALDMDPDKQNLTAKFVELYQATADYLDGLDTYQQVFTVMTNTAKKVGLSGKLPNMQRSVAAMMTTEVPGSKVLTNKIDKPKCREMLTRASKILKDTLPKRHH